MAAASFGEKLLQEIHEEGLDELLHDLRALYPQNVESTRFSRFGVAPIDEFLELFIPAPAQLPDNQQVIREENAGDQDGPVPVLGYDPARSTIPIQLAASICRPDPVLEISSTSSAAGKSQMLYYLTALSVLPYESNGIPLDGFNSAVVFIDADGRFDAERLRTVARGIVHNRLQMNTAFSPGKKPLENFSDSIEAMLLESIKHVHVFRPQSSLTLLATLETLDTYLLDLSRHVSASRSLRAIFIDSATAFYWQDKLQDEIARTEDISRPTAEIERERLQKKRFYLADVYADLVGTLKRLQRVFDCAVIYTTTSFTGRSMEAPSVPYGSYNPIESLLPDMLSFRTPLPPPWGLFPTLRLVLQRDAVRPFPPTLSVYDAQKDAPMRQEMVMRGEFLGSVNGWGREDWPRKVLEGLKRRNGGKFTFRVGGEGITFS